MRVRSGEKPSDVIKVFRHMKEITLDRNLMNLRNVGEPIGIPHRI